MKRIFWLLLCSLLLSNIVTAQVTLIPYQDSWKYLDNGTNQGTAWRSTTFSDASWKSGNAKLGYGITDETTVVSYGPDSKQKYITTYFRKTVGITNAAAFPSYAAYLKCDDGAVVYVNGTEVFRHNMRAGTVTYDSLALDGPADDGATAVSFNISSAAFISGTNVIAVEVHQKAITSSDIAFDLKLTSPDNTAPAVISINRQEPITASTALTAVTWRIVFSEPVKGVGRSDFLLTRTGTATGLISTLQSVGTDGTTYDILVNTITGSGTLRLDLRVSSTGITDEAGNLIPNGGYTLGQTYSFGSTPPTVVSIQRQNPASDLVTGAAALTYRVNFSEPVTGVDASDFLLNIISGNAAGIIASNAVQTIYDSVYDVTVTNITGAGILRLDIKSTATSITDLTGELFAGGFTAGQTYSVDRIAPAVSGISIHDPATVNTAASSLTWRIVFTEAVSGVDATDFSLNKSGTADGSIQAVTATGSNTYMVTANNISGSGTVSLQLNATNTAIADAAGNQVTTGYITGDAYQVDRTAPVVISISRQSPAEETTTATAVTFRVLFSEPVSGVDATDFIITTSGTVNGVMTAGSVAAAGSHAYNVTVSGITGSGTLRLDLSSATTGITDLLANALTTGFTTGETYFIVPPDVIAPSVLGMQRQNPLQQNTSLSSVTWRIQFSEPVVGVDKNDFTITALNGSVNGTLANATVATAGTDGTLYDVTISGIYGSGTLRLDLNAGTDIADEFGNRNPDGFTNGETFIIDDLVAPAVQQINRLSPLTGEKVAASSLTYRVFFTEPVAGVDPTDFTVVMVDGSTSGTLTASAVSAVGTIPGAFDVTITSVSGSGTLRLDLNSSNTGITDLAENPVAGGFSSGEIFQVDLVAPVVNDIQRQNPTTAITSSAQLTFRVRFSEKVLHVDVADFTIVTTGTVNASIGTSSLNPVGAAGTEFDVTANVSGGNGTVRLDLKASGTGITDEAGNNINGGFTTGAMYTTDPPPVAVSINRQVPLTGSTIAAVSVVYRIIFSEKVSGVDAADFVLAATGSATGTIHAVAQFGTDGTTYDVTVNGLTGAGTIRLDLKNSATGIKDLAANDISGGFTSGELYTIDRIAPVIVSISRLVPPNQATAASSLTFRVIFSEPVTGVDVADFTAVYSNTANGIIAPGIVANAVPNSFDITITSVTGAGTVRLDGKAAGTGIRDVPGNDIAGGFTAGDIYIVDRVAPAITGIKRELPLTAVTAASSLTFRVTFSEHIVGLDATDFSITTTGTVTGTINSTAVAGGTTSGNIFDVTVGAVTGEGTIRLDLKNTGTGITDDMANPISGGFTTGESYTINQAPYVLSLNRQSPLTEVTSATSVVFRISFSEKVTGVNSTDFMLALGGSANATIGAVTAVGTTGNIYDITVGSISGSGIVHLDLKSTGTGIVDVSGNAIQGGFTTGESYTIGQSPFITSINRHLPAAISTTAGAVTFRVTFSKKVSGVDAKDFIVTAVNGNVRGSLADLAMEPANVKETGSVVSVGSGGDVYDVSVRALAGNGTLRLDLKATGTGIKDATNNVILSGYTSGQTYSVQQVGGFTTFTDVAALSITENTGERPQAKVWTHAGKWWSVLPVSDGTKLFRLDGTTWTPVLTLHSKSDTRADCIVKGGITHILLFRGSSESYLVSVEYVAASNSYKLWTQRPSVVTLDILGTGVESASIVVDDLGVMWLAWDGTTDFKVRSSPSPYHTWGATHTVASGATSDDICALIAFPGKVGILYSDQTAKRFGFKTHTNGAALTSWSANENPAAQSAKNLGLGFADDHLNIVAASNGTLYCAIKTGYDTEGEPFLGLLVRRPTGTWDNMYTVTSNEGTKAQLVLNEQAGKVKVIYASQTGSSGGEDIMYREASISNIQFSRPYTLIGGDLAHQYNYVTTTHQNYTNELVIVATEVTSTPDRARTIFATEGAAAATTITGAVSLDRDNSTSIAMTDDQLDAAPNPMNNKTMISYQLAGTGNYELRLYNELGRQISILKSGSAEKGQINMMELDASHLAPGLYILQLQTGRSVKSIKLVVRH